jgi:hypothetical protein
MQQEIVEKRCLYFAFLLVLLIKNVLNNNFLRFDKPKSVYKKI